MSSRSRAHRKNRPARLRSCGECRACCVVLGFEAREGEAPFAKPHGEPCPHLVQIGCGIYPERPPVCRRFQCGWLQAPNLPDALRPDRCGVLFCANENLLGTGSAVYAYEMRPGAADAALPAWLIAELSAAVTVVLVRSDGSSEVLSADPGAQRQIQQSLGRMRGA